jgi:TusA-related sulfurtransferase
MATKQLDCKGLRCPQPVMKMTAALVDLKAGDVLEVVADCTTFEDDVRKWTERLKKTLVWVKDEGNGVKRIQVQI